MAIPSGPGSPGGGQWGGGFATPQHSMPGSWQFTPMRVGVGGGGTTPGIHMGRVVVVVVTAVVVVVVLLVVLVVVVCPHEAPTGVATSARTARASLTFRMAASFCGQRPLSPV